MKNPSKAKKLTLAFVAVILFLSTVFITAWAADDAINLALGRPAEAYTSSTSEDDVRTAAKAFDEIKSNDSRWAPKSDDASAWLQVDLGSVMPINKIVLRFYSEVKTYNVLVSEDGVNYTQVAYFSDGVETWTDKWRTFEFPAVNARYVKYQQLSQFMHNGWPQNSSVYDMYVYYDSKAELNRIIPEAEAMASDIAKYYNSDTTTAAFESALASAKSVSSSLVATADERLAAIAALEEAAKNLKYDLKSIAIGKTATASSSHNTWTPNTAFDGKGNFSCWVPSMSDTEAWLQVDLGEVVRINKVQFYFFSEVQNYKVLVSSDGANFTEVVNVTNGSTGTTHPWKLYSFEALNARYVRFQQLSQREIVYNNHYGDENMGKQGGACISEFYVYYDSRTDLSSAITNAESIASATNRYDSETLAELNEIIASSKAVSNKAIATVSKRDAAIAEIENAIDKLVIIRPEFSRPQSAYTSSSANGGFTAGKPFDNASGWASRWEPAASDTNAWVQVDFGVTAKINKIVFYFYRGVQNYRVLVSENGVDYTEVINVSDGRCDNATFWKTFEIPTVKARYVKFEQLSQRDASADQLSCGIISMEIFAVNEEKIMQEQLNSIKDTLPAIDYTNGKLILPTLSDSNYEARIHGSSNKSVVALDGTVYQPLETTDVSVMYKVVNKKYPDTFIAGKNELEFTVNGLYTAEPSDNKKPEIIPGIREWKGSQGVYTLDSSSRFVYRAEKLDRTMEIISGQFGTVIGKSVESIRTARELQNGDIAFILDENRYNELGDEGCYIEIGDIITVTAATEKGILYGGMTVVQMFNNSNGTTAPKGIIRDYPQYSVRSVSLDVARIWIPMDQVAQITKYLSLFKMNEIHLHISDFGGELSYIPYSAAYFNRSTLRLESKKYPAVNSVPGQFYTQEEYRAYQKDVSDFGVKVVTEIDTPAHCGWINYVNGGYMVDNYNMKLDSAEARGFIKDLLYEFLGGDDPVIVSDTFSIGCDEYTAKDDPIAFTSYMNEIAQYVNSLGYKAQFWSNNSTGGYELDFDGKINMWAYGENENFLNTDFGFINNDSLSLYIVPGEITNTFASRLDIANLYDKFEVNILDSARENPTQIVNISDPRMLGAEAAIWYDGKVGCSEFDYFDLIFNQIMIMSEKNWYGTKTEGQTAESFINRVENAPLFGFEANPSRYVPSVNGNDIVNIDFENVSGTVAYDKTQNGYNAYLNAVTISSDGANHYAVLNGGFISLPFDSVGFPYTVSFDICLNVSASENSLLFGGNDGNLYLNYNGSGKIGYVRHGYEYIFDYSLPNGKWVTLQLVCDKKELILIANGVKVFNSAYVDPSVAMKQYSSTFVLPTESIGSGINGKIDNLVIKKEALTETGIYAFKFNPTHNRLGLYDEIAISFRVPAEIISGYTNPVLKVSFNGFTYTLSAEVASDGSYIFTTPRISPNFAGETITYTLWANSGTSEVYGPSYTTSIKDYCYAALASASVSDIEKTLIADTLNYCAAAQTWMNSATPLVNAGLSDYPQYGTKTEPVIENTGSVHTGSGILGISISLSNGIRIRVNDNTMKLVVKDNTGVIKTITDFEAAANGGYFAYFNASSAAQLRKLYTFELVDGNGETVSSVTNYSFETYAYGVDEKDTALSALVKAMMVYGDSAYKFVSGK